MSVIINLWKGTNLEIECISKCLYSYGAIDFISMMQGMKVREDMYSDSDEDQHDAYLERMKQEGKIREEANDSDDSEAGSDESFNPGDEDDDVAEEYDSKASDSESSAEDADSEEDRKKKPIKKAKTVKEGKHKKEKKMKDSSAPKRPMSAYMLWLNSSRDRIKAENPGISVTEILKKAGEMWKQLSKDKKEEWDGKAEEAKKEYERAMKEYRENSGGTSKKPRKKGGKIEERKKKKLGGGRETEKSRSAGNDSFKSPEFISSEESSSESNQGKGRKRKGSDDEEKQASSTPSSEESVSDWDTSGKPEHERKRQINGASVCFLFYTLTPFFYFIYFNMYSITHINKYYWLTCLMFA